MFTLETVKYLKVTVIGVEILGQGCLEYIFS